MLDTSQMSDNSWMNKQPIVIYNEMLLRKKKKEEWTTTHTRDNMHESSQHTELRRPDSKEDTLYDSTSVEFCNSKCNLWWQNSDQWLLYVVCIQSGVDWEEAWGKLLEWEPCSVSWWGYGEDECIHVLNLNKHFRSKYFTACKLYLEKKNFNVNF